MMNAMLIGYADDVNQHVRRWMEAKAAREWWTREAFKDLEYKDGHTWTDIELAAFREDGREPPNYNLILPMREIVCGLEAQNRSDIKYDPVGPSDAPGAQAVTQLVKNMSLACNFHRHVSRTFGQATDVGLSYLEIYYPDDPFKRPVAGRSVSGFDVWNDPAARELDFSDAEDLFRAKYLRPVVAARMFPQYQYELMNLCRGYDADRTRNLSHTADYTNWHGDYPDVGTEEWNGSLVPEAYRGRERILQIVERQYKVQQWARIVRYKDGRVFQVPTEQSQEAQAVRLAMATAIVDGIATTESSFVTTVRMAFFCEDLLLADMPSPYQHREFSLIPMWAYADRYGRPMGIIRQVRTPQRDFNARMNNMLQRAMNRQVWVEEGAVDDVDQLASDLANPNAVISVNEGAITQKKVMLADELKASPVEAQLLLKDEQMIANISGVTPELQGRNTNADSGKAIAMKQNQGQTGLYTLFDNRNAALEIAGRHWLAGIQHRVTEEQAIRINEGTKGLQWLFVNKFDPASGMVANDLDQQSFDTTVEVVPFQATAQMAKLEALGEFLGPMPVEVKMAFAGKMADLADLPDKEEVIQELEMLKMRMLGMPPGPASPMAGQVPQGAMPPGAPGAPPGHPGPGGPAQTPPAPQGPPQGPPAQPPQ